MFVSERNAWRLTGRAGEVRLALRGARVAREDEVLPALWVERSIDDEPFAARVWVTLYEALAGVRVSSSDASGAFVERVARPRVREALARREIVGVRLDRGPLHLLGFEDEAEAHDDGPSGPVAQNSWVTVELVDQDGNPVPNLRFRIEFADGQVREGQLDSAGRAHFADVAAGSCDFTFTSLDGKDWAPA